MILIKIENFILMDVGALRRTNRLKCNLRQGLCIRRICVQVLNISIFVFDGYKLKTLLNYVKRIQN